MTGFDEQLGGQLAAIREQGLLRRLRRVDSPQGTRIIAQGRELLNFSSNDYLGLANHPALKQAVIQATGKWGAGSGASRLICGSLAPHHELEEALAAFKGTEGALVFSTGYAAAIGTISALLNKDDVIVVDKLVHASIVDAAKLSGAKLRIFKHNDLDDLERILRWAAGKSRIPDPESRIPDPGSRTPHPASRILIVTESVFSMDGDIAPLRNIVELKEQYGAWLMVDEAHATGLFGERRRGVVEEFGLSDRVEVQMGTLGKTLGASGGYIAGSRGLIDLLINRARSFIFSTAPVPAASAAALAALEVIQSDEGETRRVRLWSRVDGLKNGLIRAGWRLPPVRSAIIPLIVGREENALAMAAALEKRGIFVPAIRYPTVARGQARLRITLSAAHTAEDGAALIESLQGLHPVARKT